MLLNFRSALCPIKIIYIYFVPEALFLLLLNKEALQGCTLHALYLNIQRINTLIYVLSKYIGMSSRMGSRKRGKGKEPVLFLYFLNEIDVCDLAS